eukprot:12405797-Karenia_brevis.AAC.1
MQAALPLHLQLTSTFQSQLAQLNLRNARSRVPRSSRSITLPQLDLINAMPRVPRPSRSVAGGGATPRG